MQMNELNKIPILKQSHGRQITLNHLKNMEKVTSLSLCLLHTVTTPAEIIELGTKALAAYKEAAASGTQVVNRTRLMLVGQERVGKTSLKNRLAKNRY